VSTESEEQQETSRLLRRQAEKTLKRNSAREIDVSTLSREKIEGLFHELRVHQIELEMQNEEIRRAQQQFQRLMEKYFELFDRAPVGYFILDSHDVIEEVNKAGVKLLGREKNALIGSQFMNFVTVESRDAYRVYRQSVMEGTEPKSCELKLRKRGGTLIWAHIESMRLKEGSNQPQRCLVIVTDVTERRIADEKLKASERRYREVFDNSPDPMIIHHKGLIDTANKAGRELLGVKQEDEVLGLALADLVDPDTNAWFHRVSQRVAERGESDAFTEQLLTRRDGTSRNVEIASVPTTYRGIRAVLTVGRDVTARREAEKRLAQSEARYRGLFENMGNGVVVLGVVGEGEDFVCDEINAAAEAIFGRRVQEVAGKSIFDVCPVTRDMNVPEFLKSVWSTGNPESRSFYSIKDGIIEFWIESFTYKLQTGEIVWVFSDETEHRRAEQALRESEERFRTVFEAAQDGIYIKNRALRYTHVNHAMCSLLGRSPEEIIGRRDDDLYDPTTAGRITERSHRVLKGETVEAEEARTVNGEPVVFMDTMFPLGARGESATIGGICGIIRNVTERRKVRGVMKKQAEDYPSAAMHIVMKQARVAAATDSIVLLQGESGSGKDYLASWIHDHSSRAGGPYFAINCAALSRELVESELFGHERGSFTGAERRKRGMLELAEGGTILLNEIGELDPAVQSKLLVFLDNKSFLRVGGQQAVQVNCRLIAASHRDLEEEAQHGRFLRPLLYRLNVFPIRIPPLRERVEDIPIVVGEILDTLTDELQLTRLPVVDEQTMRRLTSYDWPGNVRELRNVLERSLMLWDGRHFDIAFPTPDKGDEEWSYTVRYEPGKSIQDITNEVLQALYEEVLLKSGGNKAEAARRLGLSRGALYRLSTRVSSIDTPSEGTARTEDS
jgi:PAS domain S-box-containing protein